MPQRAASDLGERLERTRVRAPADLGRLVRTRRRQLGLTQVEAAALCGVAHRFLSELERGKATAQLGKALQVTSRLGVDLWALERGHLP